MHEQREVPSALMKNRNSLFMEPLPLLLCLVLTIPVAHSKDASGGWGFLHSLHFRLIDFGHKVAQDISCINVNWLYFIREVIPMLIHIMCLFSA